MNTAIEIKTEADFGAFIPAMLDDMGLPPSEFRVYAHISRRAGGGGACWEGLGRIAAHCRITEKTARKAISSLQALRLIRVEAHPGKTNTITLTHPSEWGTPPLPDQGVPQMVPLPKETRGTPTRSGGTSNGTPTKRDQGYPPPDLVGVPLVKEPDEGIPSEGTPKKERKDQEIAKRDRDRTQPKTLNPESYIQIETGPSESGSGKTAKGKSESASKKARGRSSPETDPEEFESWWKSYYAFCLKVDASAGARAQAVEAWDCLMADGTTSEDVIEGTKAFIEFGTKTLAEGRKVIGTPHGVRFLRNLKWQEAIDRKKAAAEIDTSTPGANIQGAQQNAALNEAQIEKNRRAYIEARQAHSRARMEKWLDRGFITEFFYEGEGLRARLSDGKILNEYDFPSTDHRWFRDEKLKAALGPNYDDDPFWDLEELPVNPHAGYIPWCVKGWQPDQVFPAMA